MPFNYAVRVTRSYEFCKHFVAAWALKCDKILAYEHVGTVTEKVHIHLMIIGSSVESDQLRNIARPLGGAVLKGNGDWSFKTKDKKYGAVTDSPRYISYMSKGQYDPKYNKGYSDAELAEAKSAYAPLGKQSKVELQFNEFQGQIDLEDIPKYQVVNQFFPKGHFPAFELVQTKARAYAFKANKCIWSQATAALARTLTMTYCMRNDVSFDDKFLWK